VKHQDSLDIFWHKFAHYKFIYYTCVICGRPVKKEENDYINCDEQQIINKTHKWVKSKCKWLKNSYMFKCTVCGTESYKYKYAPDTCNNIIIQDILE
jgi:DNA-directed RNA polymerase subunit RPC12/RpoP